MAFSTDFEPSLTSFKGNDNGGNFQPTLPRNMLIDNS